MEQPILKTNRLTLRRFTPGDSDVVQKLAGNYSVSKPTLNIPYPYEDGMAEEWIDTHPQLWQSRTGIVYAITLTQSGEVIGAISVLDTNNLEGELGYWIGEPYWGQGYCTEAGLALIAFSFEQLKLKKVYAEHLATNPASGSVMKKIGMTHVGSKAKDDRNDNISTMECYEIEKL